MFFRENDFLNIEMIMRKRFSILFFVISVASIVNAQSRQSVFAEFGGAGEIFTLNYDTRFYDVPEGPGFRIGASYLKTGSVDYLRVPIVLNYLIGHDGKFLELGAGATLGNSEFLDSNSNSVGTLCFGYRVQPVDGGLCYRISLTPYFTMGNNSVFIPYFGGVSIGYCF